MYWVSGLIGLVILAAIGIAIYKKSYNGGSIMAKNPGNWFSNADEVLDKTQNLTTDGSLIGANAVSTVDLTVTGQIVGASEVNLNLPTSDPAVAGDLWNDAGTVKVSAG